jgi:hypothetical protein
MSFITQKLKPFVFATALLSLTTLAACSSPWAEKPIDFEFTGQVLIQGTNEPVEGAYVLAVYEKVDLGLGGSARYCVKTKGMMSDKEGRFHFPIDKLDGNSPHIAYAIKADHYFYMTNVPTEKVWAAQTKEAYTNRHAYLKRQNAAEPFFSNDFTGCQRPESTAAIEAAVQFMQIEVGEQIKYGRDGINRTEMIKSMQEAASKKIYKN